MVDHFATQTAGFGTDVDDIVGGTDYLFVVFHHYYRIAQLLQLAQYVYQPVRIAAMKTDTRFVQDV